MSIYDNKYSPVLATNANENTGLVQSAGLTPTAFNQGLAGSRLLVRPQLLLAVVLFSPAFPDPQGENIPCPWISFSVVGSWPYDSLMVSLSERGADGLVCGVSDFCVVRSEQSIHFSPSNLFIFN